MSNESGTKYVREQGTRSVEEEPLDNGVDEVDGVDDGTEDEQADPVQELASRELGSEVKSEVRADGSVAYFGREQADETLPRERGTNTGRTQQ